MTFGFIGKQRANSKCDHQVQMRLEVAGMSREVCESCGKVSVAYVQNHLSPARAQELVTTVGSSASWSGD